MAVLRCERVGRGDRWFVPLTWGSGAVSRRAGRGARTIWVRSGGDAEETVEPTVGESRRCIEIGALAS